MAEQYSKTYRSRKSFLKLYSRYRKLYFKKARMIYRIKKDAGSLPEDLKDKKFSGRIPNYVLRRFMADPDIYDKRKFASEYKDIYGRLRYEGMLLYFYDEDYYQGSYFRYYGYSVRPVWVE